MSVTIPLPANIPAGFPETATAAGIVYEVGPDGVTFPTQAMVMAAQTLLAGYSGSAAELTFWKTTRQAALDAQFNSHFDFAAFIRDGTATGITGAQIGTFIATIVNNYRSLRASIANAANVAAVQAINIAAGWPNNP